VKRVLLILVCATACFLLLVTPALAGKSGQTLRPEADAAINWDGWWFQFVPSTGSYWDEVTWRQAYDPLDPVSYQAVPAGRPVYLMAMWIGVNYGYMHNAPKNVLFTYDVTAPDGVVTHYGPDDVRASWTGPYVWDEWWNTFLQDAWQTDWTPLPFNPRIGAGVYGNNVMLSIGPFDEKGMYTVTESWWTGRPVNEMLYVGEPARPTHSPAGGQSAGITFDMRVE